MQRVIHQTRRSHRRGESLEGDWLLVPSSVAMAGAWIVWLMCSIGFFCLRSDLGMRSGTIWSELSMSLLVGAMAASPFFGAAWVFRRIGWARS